MVGFETTASNYAKFKALPPEQRRAKIIKWAIGGAAGVGVVAGVAVAIAFGSIAATAANESAAAAMAGGGGGGAGLPDLIMGGDADCCGQCDCGDCCAVC